MWQVEWRALSTRVGGIIAASEFLFQTAQAGENDSGYSTNVLIENCTGAAGAIQSLLRYKESLPKGALDVLERFDKWWTDTMVDLGMGRVTGFPQVQALVVLLASARAELDHVLSDHDAVIRSHVQRGFLHLQRSLVVDQELRNKWLAAFAKGETPCEQLGALHLLLHGIFAFKTDAKGERTDLILGTKLAIDSQVLAATHGMVLTEWKLVRDGESPEAKVIQALEQAATYSSGSLAGYELESERYLIVVGRKPFRVSEPIRKGGILYQVMPLILDPPTPSLVAKTLAGSK